MRNKRIATVLLCFILTLVLGTTAFADEECTVEPVAEEVTTNEVTEIENVAGEAAAIIVAQEEVKTQPEAEIATVEKSAVVGESAVVEEVEAEAEAVAVAVAVAEAVTEAEVEAETEETVAEVEAIVEQSAEEAPQISYSITFSNGTSSFDTIGGTQVAVKDILVGLGYCVEDAVITVNQNTVDTSVIQITETENGLVLTDLGPFAQADRNLVVYINGEAVELSVVDPVNVQGGSYTADVFASYFVADSTKSQDGHVNLLGDITINDTKQISLSGNHNLYLNGFTINSKSNVADIKALFSFDPTKDTLNIIDKELTFTAVEAGSVTFDYLNGTDVQYLDRTGTWTDCSKGTTITLAANEKVSFKGNNVTTTYVYNHPEDTHNFSMTGKMSASGDVTSLTNSVGGDAQLTEYCYFAMFKNCESLITAPALPATTLAKGCYFSMFENCGGLTTAPVLPATSLANECYACMFNACDNLTTAPVLPAISLADECYTYMFANCDRLTTAPALPATSLTKSCYAHMFRYCKGLTTAPVLPATSLADGCYQSMFYGCKSLTTAPALPATSLTNDCYASMFEGCTNLAMAPALPATTLNQNCYLYMFRGCKSLTTAPALPATTLAKSCYASMFKDCTNLTTAPALSATTLADCCYNSMFSGCSSLEVSDSRGIKIFTCSIGSLSEPVTDMFTGTIGGINTPDDGKTYYYVAKNPDPDPVSDLVPASDNITTAIIIIDFITLDTLPKAQQEAVNKMLKDNNLTLVAALRISGKIGNNRIYKGQANFEIAISTLENFNVSTLKVWKINDDNSLSEVPFKIVNGKIAINHGEFGIYILAA